MPDVDVWDLLDRLDAASEDADAWHHDLCQQFDDGEQQLPCSCGGGRLLIDAAAFIRSRVVEATVQQAQQAA